MMHPPKRAVHKSNNIAMEMGGRFNSTLMTLALCSLQFFRVNQSVNQDCQFASCE